MKNKIIIHTDASNIKNSNNCKIASIIEYNSKTTTIIDSFSGRINQAELMVVLNTLNLVEKNYSPENFIIELYTDHLPNVKFLNKILTENLVNSEAGLDKINKILKRKGLTSRDISVISRLQSNNDLNIIWISRTENKIADKLSKEK